MTQRIAVLTLSILASAALTAHRFVTVAGAPTGAGLNSIGVADTDGAIGDLVPVTALGTAIVTAGAAVAKGAAVEVGAAGKAITKAAGITVGRALSAAAADGDLIEVALIPN